MERRKQWILMDNLKRKLFIKQEIKKKILKSIVKNSYLPLEYRYIAFYFKIKINRKTNSIQQINRCVKTGRQWSVFKLTNYSRFYFRTQSYSGNTPGFKRASW